MTPSDEGLSGASAEKRPDFMRMYRHCKKGKIDLIITKSISRFARNTLEENSEVVLTILASLAQEELNSLSQNVKMGKRMAMQEGKVFFQYTNCYAYRKGADGQPEIIPEEAEIVKRIYTSYLAGESVGAIAKALYADGLKSHSKSGQWTGSTLRGILQSERYCGDVLLQKTFVTDPITKKVKKNNGQLPKILIKNNHTPVVSRELYDSVQQERAKRSSTRKVSKVPSCKPSTPPEQAVARCCRFLTHTWNALCERMPQTALMRHRWESRIAELKAATMELVTQSIASNSVGENQSRLKATSDEIKALCDMLAEYKKSYNSDSDIKMRMNETTVILENEPEESTTYNDTLVRQLIQTIKVMGEDKLEITFKCDMKYEQNIAPTVRKINKAS